MPTIHPLSGYFVNPRRAHEVIAPPFDVLSPAQRAEFADAHPRNYINAMRALEEFPPAERPPLDELLTANASRLQAMIDRGDFLPHESPCIYIYRLSTPDHVQTGIVAEVPIDEYAKKQIKKHEHTRRDHESQLTRYNEIVGANSSPVCLAYERHEDIDRIVRELTRTHPLFEFSAHDTVTQTIWRVDDPNTLRTLTDAFATIHTTYLTDGHHRAAAGLRYAERRRRADPEATGEEPYNFLLVALFPDAELRILPFNRCVRDLNGQSAEAFLDSLEQSFDVRRLDSAREPDRPREFTMLVEGVWYRLRLKPDVVIPDAPVGQLDVAILHHQILDPKLGIRDMRADRRLDYVPGSVGLAGLQKRSEDGWAVCFACFPTSIRQLMAVADADQVMPPKSTWFDPKARSGMFLVLR